MIMTPFKLSPALKMGAVALSVANLDRSIQYYTNHIGLTVRRQTADSVDLGTPERTLVNLVENPGARPSRGKSGLYHFALLVPTRLDLAHVLRRLIDNQTPVTGFADHAVSEAIYLNDPDGHGIEIYRDRPRNEWEYPNGQLKMTTDPIDLPGILAELPENSAVDSQMASGTVMGHMHLHVANIRASEDFYVNLLGLDLIVRYGSSASFTSAGGYHHHLGFNTWAGEGAPPPAPDNAALQWYEVVLPDATALAAVVERLTQTQTPFTESDGVLFVQDPSQNTVKFTIA